MFDLKKLLDGIFGGNKPQVKSTPPPATTSKVVDNRPFPMRVANTQPTIQQQIRYNPKPISFVKPQSTFKLPGQEVFEGVGNFVGANIVKPAADMAINTGKNVYKGMQANQMSSLQNAYNKDALNASRKINQDATSGKISWDRAKQLSQPINQASNRIGSQASQATKQFSQIDPVKAGADAAGTFLNVATLGNGKVVLDALGKPVVKALGTRLVQNTGSNSLLGGGFNALGQLSQTGSQTTGEQLFGAAGSGFGFGAGMGAAGTLAAPVFKATTKLVNDKLPIPSKLKDIPIVGEPLRNNIIANKAKSLTDDELNLLKRYKTPSNDLGGNLTTNEYRGLSKVLKKIGGEQNAQESLNVNTSRLSGGTNQYVDLRPTVRNNITSKLSDTGKKIDKFFTDPKYQRGSIEAGMFDPTGKLGKKTPSNFKKIYHGTDKIFDEFDVNKSADGSIWFTDNVDLIKKGEAGAAGKGQIVERYIDENKLKLGDWDVQDKLTDSQMIQQGYDGLKLVSDGETTYRIFDPSKTSKSTPIVTKTPDIFSNYNKRYHQTSPEVADIINKEGFRLDKRASGTNDILPIGVNTKLTDKNIRLPKTGSQLEVYFDKNANIKKFDNRDQAEQFFYGHPEGSKYRSAVDKTKQLDIDYQNKIDEVGKQIDSRYKELYSAGVKTSDDAKYKSLQNKEQSIIDEWGKKVNEQSQIAQSESTKIAKNEGIDVIDITQDTGGFGSVTDNTIILDPAKIKTKQQLSTPQVTKTETPNNIDLSKYKTSDEFVNKYLGDEGYKLDPKGTILDEATKRSQAIPEVKSLIDERESLAAKVFNNRQPAIKRTQEIDNILRERSPSDIKSALSDIYKESTTAPQVTKTGKIPTMDEVMNDPMFQSKPPANDFQDILPSKSRPESIRNIVKNGGNPLYHDTNANSVIGILDSGEIRPSQAPFSQIAGQGKRVSTTRNFDNYSRYDKSPYRLVIDESKTGQRSIPDNREEFESIFKKPVKTSSVESLAIDTTNPAILDDIKSGKLAEVIAKAKEKGIKVETFEGKILPDKYANKEIQAMTKAEADKVLQPKSTPIVTKTPRKDAGSIQIPFGKKETPTPELPIVGKNLNVKEKVLSSKPAEFMFGDKKVVKKAVAKKERGFAQSVQEAPNVKKQVSASVKGKYTPKTNDKLMGEAKALLQDGASIDFKNTKNLDQKVAATIQEALNQQKAGNHQAAADLFNNLSEHGTELGRGVQAFSLLENMSPESVALSVAGKIKKFNATHNFKKIPELGAEQMKMISDNMTTIDLLKPGREKNIALNELNNKMNDLIPSTFADKAIAVWKAGLLTSLRTHERNFVGNAVHGIAEIAKDVPATATDAILGMKTGTRTKTMSLRGLGKFGSKSTRQQIADIVSKGYDPANMVQKFDYKTVTWANTPVQQALKKYTNVVFNTLGAEDKAFYNPALARSLYDQAGAAAINAGKRGNAKFIEKLVKNPTEDMMKIAISDANTAVFKNKNMASKAVGMLKMQLDKDELTKVIGEVAMPFTGVPSSIAGQMLSYSPIGLMQGIARSGAVLAGKVPEMQRLAAQEVGRGVVGTGLIGLGVYLTQEGLMTGQPKDKKESDQWALEGKQPNSIMVGGKWRSINSVGPEALVLLAGSKLAQGKDAGITAANIGKDFTGQTFLQGMSQPLNAIADPERYGQSYISNQISSVIPNIVKDTSKAFDPLQRETKSTDLPSTIINSLKSGVPGVRNSLLPKRDNLGNPMKQEPTGVGAYVDLFNSKTPIKNPVVNELSRLNAVDLNSTPSAVSNSKNKAGVSLTPQEMDKLEAYSGGQVSKGLGSLIGSASYGLMSDEQKKTAIASTVEKIKTQAKSNLASGRTPDISVSAGVKSGDPKLTYQQHLDAYNKGIKDKTITGPDVMTKKKSLDKEAITSKYSNEVKDFYSISNTDKEAYFKKDPAKAKQLYDQAKKMDAQLVSKGLTTTKFKTTASSGGKSSGGKSSGSKSTKTSKLDYAKLFVDSYKAKSDQQDALRKLLAGIKIKGKKVS